MAPVHETKYNFNDWVNFCLLPIIILTSDLESFSLQKHPMYFIYVGMEIIINRASL